MPLEPLFVNAEQSLKGEVATLGLEALLQQYITLSVAAWGIGSDCRGGCMRSLKHGVKGEIAVGDRGKCTIN